MGGYLESEIKSQELRNNGYKFNPARHRERVTSVAISGKAILTGVQRSSSYPHDDVVVNFLKFVLNYARKRKTENR